MHNKKNEQFLRAVEYIYKFIDQQVCLDAVANYAHVSVATLKRLFTDYTEKTPGQFIRRMRMEQAFQALQNTDDDVIQVALASGFSDHAAFARCFKKCFGKTPAAARERLQIVSELEHIELLEPDIKRLEDIVVQGVTVQGLYFESAPRAWQQLHAVLETLPKDEATLFIGIGHDNPHEGQVSADAVRFTAGIASGKQKDGLASITLKSGDYAKFSFKGRVNNLGMAYHYIYGAWQERSCYNVDYAKPAFQVFDDFPMPSKDESVLIYVPVKV